MKLQTVGSKKVPKSSQMWYVHGHLEEVRDGRIGSLVGLVDRENCGVSGIPVEEEEERS